MEKIAFSIGLQILSKTELGRKIDLHMGNNGIHVLTVTITNIENDNWAFGGNSVPDSLWKELVSIGR